MRHAMMTGPEVLRKHKTVFQVKMRMMVMRMIRRIMRMNLTTIRSVMIMMIRAQGAAEAYDVLSVFEFLSF